MSKQNKIVECFFPKKERKKRANVVGMREKDGLFGR